MALVSLKWRGVGLVDVKVVAPVLKYTGSYGMRSGGEIKVHGYGNSYEWYLVTEMFNPAYNSPHVNQPYTPPL